MDAKEARAKFDVLKKAIETHGSGPLRNDPAVKKLVAFVDQLLPAAPVSKKDAEKEARKEAKKEAAKADKPK